MRCKLACRTRVDTWKNLTRGLRWKEPKGIESEQLIEEAIASRPGYEAGVRRTISLALMLMAAASACSISPPQREASPGLAGPLKFVDLDAFDSALAKALASDEPSVRVEFYDKFSPNQIPRRLQRWLAAAEKAGRRVSVQPPPDDVAAKSPVAIAGLVGSLWSNLRALGEFRDDQLIRSVSSRDATLQLERRPNGDVVIAWITFTRAAGTSR